MNDYDFVGGRTLVRVDLWAAGSAGWSGTFIR